MERVVKVPELLLIILSFCTQSEAARCSQVCEAWKKIATPVIWEEIDDCYPIFHALGDMDKIKGEWKLRHPPSIRNWKRLLNTLSMVRILRFDPTTCRDIAQASWNELNASRPHGPLLPRLQALEWMADSEIGFQRVHQFAHSAVTRFTVRLPPDVDNFLPYLLLLARRMPNLTHLKILTRLSVSSTEEAVARYVYLLPRLFEVILPLSHFTSRILNSLSCLKFLHDVKWSSIDNTEELEHIEALLSLPIAYNLASPAFPNLNMLCMDVTLSAFAQLLMEAFSKNACALESIYGRPPIIEEPSVVRQFFDVIARLCPLINTLTVFLAKHPVWRNNYASTPTLPFECILPTLRMSGMKSFAFSGEVCLQITDNHLEKAVASWPLLERLEICNNVRIVSLPPVASGLTLAAFPLISKYCPKMKRLVLYFDARQGKSSLAEELTVCKNLEWLGILESPIDDPRETALFFSHMIPSRATRFDARTWCYDGNRKEDWSGSRNVNVHVLDYLDENASKWHEVINTYLPLFLAARDRWKPLGCKISRQLERRKEISSVASPTSSFMSDSDTLVD